MFVEKPKHPCSLTNDIGLRFMRNKWLIWHQTLWSRKYIRGFRSPINGGLVPGGTWRQNEVGLTSMRLGGITFTHHRCLRHHKWLYNIPFPPSPVFSCPCRASKVQLCPLLNIFFLPLLLLTFLLYPCTVPCRIVFPKPENLETLRCSIHRSFRFLTKVRSSSCLSSPGCG